ncbi:hypothetical protein [Paenibacillus sp. FSL K6-1230]|uniref:hypothetical protein n=1 Tax=Paenibacillus sp. FSL K6-1230 TaxID=2921603 RepID=UPI0030F6943C
MNPTRFIERVFFIKRSQPSDAAEIAINEGERLASACSYYYLKTCHEDSARIIKGTGKRTAHKSLSRAGFYLTANL